MPDAAPVEPITLPAPADYTVEGRGDLVERARAFRVLPQEQECAQSSPEVIVVCAPEDEERYRYRPAGPEPTTATLLPVFRSGGWGTIQPSFQPRSAIAHSIDLMVTG